MATDPVDPEAIYWRGRGAMNAQDKKAIAAARESLVRLGKSDDKARCLATLLDAAMYVAKPAPKEALALLVKAEPEARSLFGPYSKVHCDALAQYNYARGYAGDLDGELAGTQELLAYFEKNPTEHALDIAECYNTIGMNFGLRGDHLTELRLQQKGLKMVLQRAQEGGEDAGALAMAEWTLRNSLANAASSAGDHDNARHSAKRCKEILGGIAPAASENSISDQLIARSFWCLDDDLDSSLHYISSAIDRLAKDPDRGPGSGPWLSYTSYKTEYLVQAGRAAEAVALTGAALPYVRDAAFTEGSVGESMFKLLLARGSALLANGDLDGTAKALTRLRAGLSKVAVQRDVLAIRVLDLELRYLERTGDHKTAGHLIDSVITRYDLLAADSGQVNRASIDPVFLRTFIHFGEYRVDRAAAQRDTPAGQQERQVATALLEKAVRFQRDYRDLYFTSGANDNMAPDELDATALLLKAYALAPEGSASPETARAIAAVFAGSKSRLLDRQLRLERTFAQVLTPEEENQRVLLRSRIFSAINDYLNEASTAKSTALVNARTAYDVRLEELRAKYPALRAPGTAAACDAVAVAATENAVVLDYYLGGNDLFILRSTGDGQRLFRRDVPKDLLTSIARFRSQALNDSIWEQGFTPPADVQAYPAQWKALLVDGILDPANAASKLIVIPHKELSLINFEFLPGLRDPQHYLIEDIEIRFELSSSVLCATSGPLVDEPLRMGGFSATTFSSDPDMDADVKELVSRGGLADLKGTAEETDSVAAMFGGKHFAHATAADFTAHAGEFNLLHVGTHGIAYQNGSGNAYLLFEGDNSWADRVTHAQVAGMDLPCELVVLSACNTSLGKLHGGEGASSLSRAFFQAGSRSVVSSLWQVPDDRTREIMTGFYGYLKQGMTRSAALRKAKLDHLAKYSSGVQRMPYFWSGFVLFGADGALAAPPAATGGMRWWWALVPIGALLAYFLFKPRRIASAR